MAGTLGPPEPGSGMATRAPSVGGSGLASQALSAGDTGMESLAPSAGDTLRSVGSRHQNCGLNGPCLISPSFQTYYRPCHICDISNFSRIYLPRFH